MTEFYKCDKCKKQFEKKDLLIVSFNSGFWKGEYQMDLCNSCSKKLKDFLLKQH